ncbi:pentatricopeptide repeat-containing protein At3g53360, mitochondrial-like [Aristolochia californica]|uniref:pentatricopeptide repeat-containing protein At3g53360, mitochondrial-like n=1 Tax=Aristolochia californica TaxID=171875 RepID=UPI0035E10F1D
MNPNSVTISGLLSACSLLRKVKMVRVVHLLAIQFGLVEDALVRNDLVDMYAKCGMVRYVNFIFSSNLSEDMVPWNTMIGGFALKGYVIEDLSWFHRLRSSSTLPDVVTLVNVVSASAYAHGRLFSVQQWYAHNRPPEKAHGFFNKMMSTVPVQNTVLPDSLGHSADVAVQKTLLLDSQGLIAVVAVQQNLLLDSLGHSAIVAVQKTLLLDSQKLVLKTVAVQNETRAVNSGNLDNSLAVRNSASEILYAVQINNVGTATGTLEVTVNLFFNPAHCSSSIEVASEWALCGSNLSPVVKQHYELPSLIDASDKEQLLVTYLGLLSMLLSAYAQGILVQNVEQFAEQ